MGRAPVALGLVLLLSVAGCSGVGGLSSSPELPALPGVAGLDNLRGAAAEHGSPINLSRSVFSENVTAADGGLDLAAGPALSCVMYRISISYVDILSVSVDGSGDLWVMMPDFAEGVWKLQQQLPPEGLTVQLSTFEDPLSPGGYAYVAIVGGPLGGHLSAVDYTYDGPAHLYFVATDGDDAGPGDAEEPWASLQHAADMVQEDTLVIVRQGQYQGFTLSAGGTADGQVVFHGESAEIVHSAPGPSVGIEVQEEASHLLVEGLQVRGFPEAAVRIRGSQGAKLHDITVRSTTISSSPTGIEIRFADRVTMEGLEVQGCSGWGVQASHDSDELTLRRCVLHDNVAGGLNARDGGAGGGVLDGARFEGNLYYSHAAEGAWGMQVEGATGALFVNNLIYGCRSCLRIHGDGGTPVVDCELNNNTFATPVSYHYCLQVAGGCSGVSLHNNVLINPNDFFGSVSIDTASLPTLVADNNVYSTYLFLDGAPRTIPAWQAATSQDAASIYGDVVSLFVNYSGGDYHLKSGSGALNRALPQYAPEQDYDAAPRPLGSGYDCGCYESGL